MNQKNKILLFVYGTLLSGEPNHTLLNDARFMGKAMTQPCYELLDFGFFPTLVPEGHVSVCGEVYAVDEKTLQAIDQLEGHPHWYRRTVITLADGREVFTYIQPKEHAKKHPRIQSGDWRIR
ncbi:gamma-glutamylcyclotransferase [candidate division CSSED10-310 bacterium]|uniref:Gamma-glutamylcyclotransferase family protein n=1 Tax=candidate division CSSED10-310 bacterium TaxID=2855610 RepID=A0ABV6Z6P9_UNCC1